MQNWHDKYRYVGKSILNLSIRGCDPFARCVVEPGTDAESLIADISAAVDAAFKSRCIDVEFPGRDIDIRAVHDAFGSGATPIKTEAEDKVEFERTFAAIQRPVKPPEQIEAERQETVARLQAMSLMELADEYGERVGGSYDNLVHKEMERRAAIMDSLAADKKPKQVPRSEYYSEDWWDAARPS